MQTTSSKQKLWAFAVQPNSHHFHYHQDSEYNFATMGCVGNSFVAKMLPIVKTYNNGNIIIN
jgi:hypothetical protein